MLIHHLINHLIISLTLTLLQCYFFKDKDFLIQTITIETIRQTHKQTNPQALRFK